MHDIKTIWVWNIYQEEDKSSLAHFKCFYGLKEMRLYIVKNLHSTALSKYIVYFKNVHKTVF